MADSTKRKSYFIVRTALLLALALVCQMLRFIIPAIPPVVVGTLVNTVLLTSVCLVGIPSALIVSIVTPIVAFFQGMLPVALFIPCIVAGNAAYVLLFGALHRIVRKRHWDWVFMSLASIAKFTLLWVLMVIVVIPVTIPKEAQGALMATFGISQLITAFVGGAIALLVAHVLEKTIRHS